MTKNQVSTLCADLKYYFGWRTVVEEQTNETEPSFVIFMALENTKLIVQETERQQVGRTHNNIKD
jgi:hypothetical protein